MLEKLYEKDLLAVVWKTLDTELRPVEEVIHDFVSLVTESQPLVDESNPEEELFMPPTLKPFEVIVPITMDCDDAESVTGILKPTEIESNIQIPVESTTDAVEKELDDKEPKEGGVEEETAPEGEEEPKVDEVEATDESKLEGVEPVGEEPGEEREADQTEEVAPPMEPEKVEPEPKSVTSSKQEISNESKLLDGDTRKITLPALWTPNNKRANTALIYLYFRHVSHILFSNSIFFPFTLNHFQLTDHFLPPDAPPEPPHVVVIFDAFKQRDVFEVIEQHTDDVLAFGFFNSHDPKVAELLAVSVATYEKRKPTM